jgi:hypothetical protein
VLFLFLLELLGFQARDGDRGGTDRRRVFGSSHLNHRPPVAAIAGRTPYISRVQCLYVAGSLANEHGNPFGKHIPRIAIPHVLRRKETTLPTKSEVAQSTDARTRADASFKKEERAKDGAKAMMEYLANGRMVRERTERLRALRLAKEAADKKKAEPASKPVASKRERAKV